MAQERKEFSIIKCDARKRTIKQENWKTVEGEFYIRVFLHADKSSSQKEHFNARRFFLPEGGDPKNPAAKLTLYTKTPSGKNREKSTYMKLIREDVRKFKEHLGYLASVAPDESQSIVKKPKTISDLWALYKEEDLMKRVSLKTFQDKLETDTIQSHQNSFNRYVNLFEDHKINEFPKNVENKFRQLAPTLPQLKNPHETLSPITVRTIGGHLNRFFDWCSLEEMIPGRPKKLLLPSKKLKKHRTAIPSIDQRKSVEAKLRAEVSKWSKKEYRKKNRTTEHDRFRTLLRIYLLANYASMRRGEVYSLPLRNIDLEAKRIYIEPINEDGGTDFKRNPIQVKFRPKAGEGVDYQPIVDYLVPFLEENLAKRKPEERWFLDKSDGSVWFASPDGMTKGIKIILKEMGIEGGCLHWFRKARLNDIWEKNPNASKHFGRHSEIETTESHYTSGEKPSDLTDLVDQIDKEQALLN